MQHDLFQLLVDRDQLDREQVRARLSGRVVGQIELDVCQWLANLVGLCLPVCATCQLLYIETRPYLVERKRVLFLLILLGFVLLVQRHNHAQWLLRAAAGVIKQKQNKQQRGGGTALTSHSACVCVLLPCSCEDGSVATLREWRIHCRIMGVRVLLRVVSACMLLRLFVAAYHSSCVMSTECTVTTKLPAGTGVSSSGSCVYVPELERLLSQSFCFPLQHRFLVHLTCRTRLKFDVSISFFFFFFFAFCTTSRLCVLQRSRSASLKTTRLRRLCTKKKIFFYNLKELISCCRWRCCRSWPCCCCCCSQRCCCCCCSHGCCC